MLNFVLCFLLEANLLMFRRLEIHFFFHVFEWGEVGWGGEMKDLTYSVTVGFRLNLW